MDLVDLSFTSFDDLPDGLVADILSRLPVKTLVRSTSVSKLWYSLIKTPSFIHAHLSRSSGGSDLSNSYIFIVQPQSSSVTVISDNHVLTRHPNFIIPFETRTQTYEVIGNCKGLICLTDDDEKYHGGDIYLVNPFIHKYKKIGAKSSCYSDLIEQIDGWDSGQIRVCFWYCEVEKDYKIFRIIFRHGDSYNIIVSRSFEIYSLNTGTWKVMEGMDGLDVNRSCPIFVNGCLYWEPWPENSHLQYFDLKEKLFYNISLPSTVSNSISPTYHITGLLAKEGSITFWDRRGISPPQRIYLYLLEKGNGGWKELFHHESQFCIYYNSMGFSGIGRFIFCECYARKTNIVALDLDKSCAVEKLILDFEDASMMSTVAFNVLESLVLISD